MKTLLQIGILATLALVTGFAHAQTMDDYCVQVSELADELDLSLAKMTITVPASLSPAERDVIFGYLTEIGVIQNPVRHDACFSANLAAAHVAVERGYAKQHQLLKAMAAYVTHVQAENRRAQAAR